MLRGIGRPAVAGPFATPWRTGEGVLGSGRGESARISVLSTDGYRDGPDVFSAPDARQGV